MDGGENPADERLPDGWTTATLNDVAEINPSLTSADLSDDMEVSFLPMAAVEAGTGRLDASERRRYGDVKKGYTRFEDGDVLFAKITPCMENGKIAVATGLANGIGCGTTEFHVLRPRPGNSAHYLSYFLIRQAFRGSAERNMTGTAGQRRVPVDYLRLHPIPVAPSREQDRIVAKLDELFSQIEKGEEGLRRAQALLKQYRQSVLKAAVTGELTRDWREKNAGKIETGVELLQRILKARRDAWEAAELAKMKAKGKRPKDDSWKLAYTDPAAPDACDLPELPNGWTWVRLGQLFRVYTGATPSRREPKYWGGNIPWISSGEVAFCRISKTRETISEEGFQNSSVRMHPPGTVLLAMIGEGKTRGQAAILDLAACNNQNAAAIRVSETPIPPEYIYLVLEQIYEDNRRQSRGGNQPALNKELVEGIVIPLPGCAEISAITDAAERYLSNLERCERTISKEIIRFHALRQSILRAAFSGKLVMQVPDNEPASVLLERIATELATAPARARKPMARRSGKPAHRPHAEEGNQL